jgi:DNA-binding transcriptional MerR regulator
MKEYSTKAIADQVGISASKLRYYAKTLENAGYSITRDDRGFRIYTDNDIPVFQEMIKQSNETDLNVEQIALKLTGQNDEAEPETAIIPEDDSPGQNEGDTRESQQMEDEHYKILLDEIHSLKQLIANQQKYIDERMEQRDLKSLEIIRKSQEVKKADLELAAAQEKEKKKGFFSKLFKL